MFFLFPTSRLEYAQTTQMKFPWFHELVHGSTCFQVFSPQGSQRHELQPTLPGPWILSAKLTRLTMDLVAFSRVFPLVSQNNQFLMSGSN